MLGPMACRFGPVSGAVHLETGHQLPPQRAHPGTQAATMAGAKTGHWAVELGF